MNGRKPMITGDVIDVAPPLVALLMFGLAFSTFTYNHLFEYLLGLMHIVLPVSGPYLYVAIAVVILPLALIRIWNNSLLSAVAYLSWALYIPSVLFFCGIDPFRIIEFSADFSFFSSGLTQTAVTAAGIALACGSLMARSLMYIRNARDNFIGRGANEKEAYRVLYRNAFFEMKIILASALAILLIIAGVQAVLQDLLGLLKAASYIYVLAGLCAVVMLALVFLVYLWPRKKSEKG